MLTHSAPMKMEVSGTVLDTEDPKLNKHSAQPHHREVRHANSYYTEELGLEIQYPELWGHRD